MRVESIFTPLFFRQLQQLKIHTRRVYLGSRQGSHISRRRGHGLEFSDYRHYAPGDDFRHIDWNVYGRTDRLYVREFREEQDLNVMFLVDTSSSMAHPEGERKFELVRQLVLSLGFVALSDGDTVTIAALGQKMSPKFIGARSLVRMWNFLEGLRPTGKIVLEREVRAALSMFRIPGKCFFLSDFLVPHNEIFKSCDIIRGRNFDLSMLHVLAPSELKLSSEELRSLFVDSETGETIDLPLDRGSQYDYAKLLAEHIGGIERYARNAAVAHVLISSAESVSDIVLTRLPEIGLLQ